MKISVFVKLGKKVGIEGWNNEMLVVRVNARPVDGEANKRLAAILSERLNVSRSRVKIANGHTSRYKTLEINISDADFMNYVSNIKK